MQLKAGDILQTKNGIHLIVEVDYTIPDDKIAQMLDTLDNIVLTLSLGEANTAVETWINQYGKYFKNPLNVFIRRGYLEASAS